MRHGLMICAPVIALCVLVGGCVTPGGGFDQPPDARVLGRVTAVQGPSAFVEHLGRTSRAQFGQPIFENDRFFTGDGSKLRIGLAQGGELDVAPNTDPTLVQEAQCLFIRLFRSGAMFLSGSQICVESAPNAVIQHSRVGYRVLPQPPGLLRVTVIEGQVTTLQPPGIVVSAGNQIDLLNGRVARGPYPSSPADRREATSWTNFGGRGPDISIGIDFFGGHSPRPSPRPRPRPPPPPAPPPSVPG